METIDPGFVNLVLGKEYTGFEAGSTVWVDPARAEWLRANGYERVDVKTVVVKAVATGGVENFERLLDTAIGELKTPPTVTDLPIKENK